MKEVALGRLHKEGWPPLAAAPVCGFPYMVAGEVASIAKTYRRISKCALSAHTTHLVAWHKLKG